MNRKGLIRIVEASLAILIILSVLIIIVAQRSVPAEQNIGRILPPLLEEIAQDNGLRMKIINYDTDKNKDDEIDNGNGYNNAQIIRDVKAFINLRITNPSLGYDIEICEREPICALKRGVPLDSGGEIFAEERVISTYLKSAEFKPKKIKIFLWRIQ